MLARAGLWPSPQPENVPPAPSGPLPAPLERASRSTSRHCVLSVGALCVLSASVDRSLDCKTSTVKCDFSVRPILQSSFLRRPTAAMGACSRPEPGGSVTPEVDGAPPRQQSGDRAERWREGGDKGGQPDEPQRVRVPHAASLCKKPKVSCAATTGATPSASDSSDLNDRSAAVPLPKPSMRAWRRAQARRQNPLTRTRAAVDGAPLSRVGLRRRGRHEECVSPLSVTFSVTLHAGPEARPFWQ